MSKINGK